MSTATRRVRSGLGWLPAVVAAIALSLPAAAQQPVANDSLDAVLWVQRSVEYRGAALGTFALARMRLDQALAEPGWTAAPAEQSGDIANLPPAIIVDLDETVLDNSAFHAWQVRGDRTFDPKAWTQFVNADVTAAIEGAVDFARYADSHGVKVFYVTNRTIEEKDGTRKTLQRLGFPMGGNVDVLLATREKPDWTSAKGTRRAVIAKDYRVLLNLGDQLGDFVDNYRGSEADRMKVFEENRSRWGREWIVLPNPKYGSFESAPYGHDFRKSRDEQRKAKLEALQPWAGP